MTVLTIPIALDMATGRLVHAHEGERGRSFECPQCRASVVWRKCDDVKRRSHFAHASDSGCGESAIHAAAKMLIAQQIRDWQAGVALHPVITGACRKCEAKCHPRSIDIDGEPHVEQGLESGFIPDVMVGYKLAIEVLYKHPIPEEKIDSFKNAGIHWIEVNAEGVLDDPSEWFVVRSDRYGFICSKCSAAQQEVARNALEGESKLRRQIARLREEAELVDIDRKASATALNDLQLRVDALKREADSLKKNVGTTREELDSVRAEHRAAKDSRDADLKTLQRELDANRLELRRLMGGRDPKASLADGLGRPIRLGADVTLVVALPKSFMPVARGTVWFVDREENWIFWVSHDGEFHTSRPTSLHTIQEAPAGPVAHA